MKMIQNKKELLALKQELPDEFIKYLEDEFLGLYEYLSNDEHLDEFELKSYQAMVVLEGEKELTELIQNQMELEYMEEVYLKNTVILRIGRREYDDIQLCYSIIKD